jgi:hypothetical protein
VGLWEKGKLVCMQVILFDIFYTHMGQVYRLGEERIENMVEKRWEFGSPISDFPFWILHFTCPFYWGLSLDISFYMLHLINNKKKKKEKNQQIFLLACPLFIACLY